MKPLKLSFLLILIGSVLLLNGASETPEPNPNQKLQETRSDKHKEAAKNIEQPTKNQPQKPTPFQTEILEAIRTIAKQNKTAYEQGRADEKSWTSPSVLVNIGLFIVGAAYTFFAWRQWKAIRRQADIADKTLSAIKHQATVANTTLAVTLRPKLIIRNVKIISDTEQDDWIIKPGEFYLEVVNRGGSDTKIRSGKVAFYIDSINNPGFMKRPTDYSRWKDALSGEILNPGFERFYKAAYEGVSVQDNLGIVLGFKNGTLTVYGLGYFLYQDGIGNHYKTSFCRRYDRSIGRFIVVDDPDYEYAD